MKYCDNTGWHLEWDGWNESVMWVKDTEEVQ